MTYKHVDQTYFDLINDVLTNGVEKSDRTGTGTISVFGRQVRYDLSLGFPILTSKRVHWKSVVGELLWFLRGDTNIKWLKENGISIWDEWADENGNLGPVYGKQWRSWEGADGVVVDQIKDLIHQISARWRESIIPDTLLGYHLLISSQLSPSERSTIISTTQMNNPAASIGDPSAVSAGINLHRVEVALMNDLPRRVLLLLSRSRLFSLRVLHESRLFQFE